MRRARPRSYASAGRSADARGRVAVPVGAVPAGRQRADDRRANATPTARRRSARRCWTSRFGDCVEIARAQIRDGSHLLDVCIDYVGRDGVGDMREIAGRFATASTLPIVLDSTEPAVIEAGLEMLGGRSRRSTR